MEINLIILAVICYFIGSIPFAYILTKLFGFGDVRNIGSGNVGATNVLRTGQKKLAFLVLFFDILKGFLPLIVLNNYLFTNSSELIVCSIASLTILGHILPLWLRFKGGKGVATYVGYIFAINYIFGLFFIFSWLFIASIKKYSSLASIVSLIMLPLLLYVMQFNKDINLLILFISIIILIKHYPNILRLFNKTESKIKF
jgi:glycerol-3-phosphate acyltransferase PlsY